MKMLQKDARNVGIPSTRGNLVLVGIVFLVPVTTGFTTTSSNWPPSVTEWAPPVTRVSDACPVIELGIGLGVSCGFVIFILLSVIVCLCVENKALRQYKKEDRNESHDGRPNHPATGAAGVHSVQPSSSSSTQYEQPLPEGPYHREYTSIDPYNRISEAETEGSHYYERPNT